MLEHVNGVQHTPYLGELKRGEESSLEVFRSATVSNPIAALGSMFTL